MCGMKGLQWLSNTMCSRMCHHPRLLFQTVIPVPLPRCLMSACVITPYYAYTNSFISGNPLAPHQPHCYKSPTCLVDTYRSSRSCGWPQHGKGIFSNLLTAPDQFCWQNWENEKKTRCLLKSCAARKPTEKEHSKQV